TADHAVISCGSGETDADFGEILFWDDSTAGNATLIANAGTGGATGGSILFGFNSTGGAARVEVFGNGKLDFSISFVSGVSIGSLEGDGMAFLGSIRLTVGRNNLSKTFSGIIQDGGSSGGTGSALTKVGTGKLTLSGANTYTGGTTVNAGTLLVGRSSGSGTGTGPVRVKAGELGGNGRIGGAVIIGDGSGDRALLNPGLGITTPIGTLTIQKKVTFKADANFVWDLDNIGAAADMLIAKGVSIESGAFFETPEGG